MNENFEQDIPIPALIAGFVVLLIFSNLLRSWLRERKLVRDGQVSTEGGRIPSINERVAGNKAWARGEILSNGRSFMIAIWMLTVTWILTFGVSFVKSLSNPEMKTAPCVVLGVFAAAGFVCLYFAVRATMRHLRFGESRCIITNKAGVLGQKIEGVIRTNSEIGATGDYTIELQCVETYSTGSGKNSKTEVRVHFQSKITVAPAGKSSRMGIPFSFDIPKYPPETGYQIARGNINWQIKIDAPVKGVDYSAIFIVPVFKMDYTD